MGGSAFLFEGDVAEERLHPKRGLMARLFGRGGRRETPIGRDQVLIELPAGGLKKLPAAFRAFLRERMPSPWPATKSVLDYLEMAATVYLRGEQEGEREPRWYVQLTFSGCAGMADVSAELAAHWAATWYRTEYDQIARGILEPAGFRPRPPAACDEERTTFLPIGDLGYAEYFSAGWPGLEPGEKIFFEIDGAVRETDEHGATALLSELQGKLLRLMQDGVCRCQMCSPSFDPSICRGLPMVD